MSQHLVEVLALLANIELLSTLGQLHDLIANLDTGPDPEPEPPRPVQRVAKLRSDEVATLCIAYTGGVSVIQLAELYGTHRTTVMAHLERNGIPRRQCVRALSDDEVTRAAQHYAAGESFATIAKRYKVSARTIARELHRAGVEVRSRIGT